MKNKLTKYGMMIVAAVLLVAMAFAGAASATEVSVADADQLDAAFSNTTVTKITLANSFEMNAEITVDHNTILDLAGYTLTARQDSKSRLFVVNGTGTVFTLNDSVGGGKLTGGSVKLGSTNTGHGGGVFVKSGTFIMNGGSITDCKTTKEQGRAGGVYVQTGAFNMNGGNITNCNATNRGCGGGVYLQSGTFTMTGGNITNCYVEDSTSNSCSGGGVYIQSGTFTMTNGNITNCHAEASSAETYAGGVYVQGAGKFVMTGGNIIDCVATSTHSQVFGGGVYAWGEVIMTGGKITGCAAVAPYSYGSGVYHGYGGGKFIMNNTALVDANNDVFLYGDNFGGQNRGYITLGEGGFQSGTYGALNISLSTQYLSYSDWVNYTIVQGASDKAASLANFVPSSNIPASYVLKANGNDLVLKEFINYGIAITNATGSYQLTSELTTVYGDDPATDGTAVVTNESGKLVLTLNNFKASNTTGNVPIINASVADLTIVLNGESNLTGSYANNNNIGLLYSSGNLMINGTDDSSKLLVNNTNSSSNDVYSISIKEGLTIDNAKVTVIANSFGGTNAYALTTGNDNLTITGSKTVIVANASSSTLSAISIGSGSDINIDSSAKVTANAQGNTMAFAFSTMSGKISIGSSSIVEANATSATNQVWLICSLSDINIDSSAKVTANAQGNDETYALLSLGGNVSIGSSAIVEANANSTNSEAYSIYADQDILIDSVDVLNATACGNQLTGAIYSNSGDIIVKGTDTKINAKAESSDDESDAIWATHSIQIDSAKLINATSDGCTNAYALGSSNDINITNTETICANANCSTGDAYAIFTWNTDILIDSVDVLNATACGNNLTAAFYTNGWVGSGDITVKGANTKINAKAESISQDAYAIYIAGKIGISSLQTLTAIGTTSSFAYYTGPCDVTDLSDYTFSNASVPGDEPNSYTAFTDNWYLDSINYHCSNYTAVKIEKGSGIPASIKVTVTGSNAGTDPVNLTLTPVSTGTSGTYDIGTNTTYTIKPVTPGVYSLDAIYTHDSMEHKLTKQVTVTTSNRTDVTFDLLTTNVTTKVKINQATSAPNVAVDGLDTVAQTIQPAAGQMVIISLGVDGTSGTSTADQQMLKSNRTYSAGTPSFINFTVTNTTSYINGTVISNSTMDNLSTVLTIYVAYDMTRDNIEVFRIHNGTVENFTETSTMPTTPSDRTFFKGESGIYIYTQKFSTYMISSTGPSSPVTPSSGGSSSSHHSGSSQLAKSPTVTPTAEPTVVPTQAQSTVIPTPVATSATTQPTQSSPAPVAGIIVGLGAAALVLSRLRK